MKLSVEQVRHVAELARLELSPDEETLYREQLSAILGAVETLSALDTEGVEPTAYATLAEAVLREDVVQPSLGAEEAVRNAPSKIGTSFAVPKIIE